MRAARIIAAVSVGATALAVGPLATPAGAAVASTTAGTAVTVTVTGEESISFGCTGGKFTVNSAVAAPPLDCTTVTQVTVNGDGSNQYVYAGVLDDAPFTGLPKIIATLQGGSDYVAETQRADQISMGAGNDSVRLQSGGAANGSVDLGGDTGDSVRVSGTSLNDTMTATSVGASVSVSVSNTSGVTTSTATNAENLSLGSDDGTDTVSSVGVTGASTIDFISLEGGAGDDTLTDGPVGSYLYGGTGTNTLTGGAGQDAYWSESATDVLNGGDDASPEYIYDTDGLRSGGRTLSGFTAGDTYNVQAHQGDATMRIRPGSGGVLFTTTLTRTGQQLVPSPTGGVSLGQAYVGSISHRGIADVVATSATVNATLPNTGSGIIDITIPTGPFTPLPVGSSLTVNSTYGQISATNVDAYRVHGPWTDKNQGFAHRVTRDLMFRFATDATRDQIRDQLTGGTKTRAQVTASLMNTDEYRGLDVDRVFVEYLRRPSDPGGRTYWINSLRNGKALWRFRAQLFGSNEYFTKAGGTNASYVTKAYNDVLGRNPDPSGQAYWTTKLNGGTDRGSVALQFINSAEARRRLVDEQFLRFIDRLPTAGEQATWVPRITGATGEQDLIAFLATSGTYYNRS